MDLSNVAKGSIWWYLLGGHLRKEPKRTEPEVLVVDPKPAPPPKHAEVLVVDTKPAPPPPKRRKVESAWISKAARKSLIDIGIVPEWQRVLEQGPVTNAVQFTPLKHSALHNVLPLDASEKAFYEDIQRYGLDFLKPNHRVPTDVLQYMLKSIPNFVDVKSKVHLFPIVDIQSVSANNLDAAPAGTALAVQPVIINDNHFLCLGIRRKKKAVVYDSLGCSVALHDQLLAIAKARMDVSDLAFEKVHKQGTDECGPHTFYFALSLMVKELKPTAAVDAQWVRAFWANWLLNKEHKSSIADYMPELVE